MSEAYEHALAEHGLEDVQPGYRKLLLRLKALDASAYETAVDRYRSDVEPRSESAPAPLDVWLAYGRWLASLIEPGRLLAVLQNGRAEPVEGTPPAGPLLIHLPEATNRRGVVVAMPATPSEAQRETAALLCE